MLYIRWPLAIYETELDVLGDRATSTVIVRAYLVMAATMAWISDTKVRVSNGLVI